jgi:hypothetical protein
MAMRKLTRVPVLRGIDKPSVVARADAEAQADVARFDDLYDRMQAQLNALRCVGSALDTPAIDGDEDLVAARGLFHQTFRELDRLHSEFETWWINGPGTEGEAQS